MNPRTLYIGSVIASMSGIGLGMMGESQEASRQMAFPLLSAAFVLLVMAIARQKQQEP